MRARRRFQVDRDFDRVFVVCDCAGESLAEAQRLAAVRLKNASGNMLSIELIVSRPCFEYWMLLHFEYNARPFRNADEVIGILRRHVTDYDKADRRIFEKVASGLDRARANVTSLQAELAATQSQSPNTDMSVLVAALDGLRREEH